ncbi:MAG: hypothetical protein PHU34_10770 [Candidatus Methanoperedens sp.]|nr:hypothetical protein [Candidatus Methanoperedens sp.]
MKSDCAQITIDYIAGIGIFLLSVVFVFQFMYSLFIPFESGSDKAALAADRAGTVLVERMLHATGTVSMNVIDERKLSDFYIKLNNNETDVLKETGLFSNQTVFDLNVSVVNLTSNIIINQSGPALPENTDIVQTKRVVLIVNSTNGNQTYASFSVRVW